MSNKNKELVTFVFEEDSSVFWDGIIVEADEGVRAAGIRCEHGDGTWLEKGPGETTNHYFVTSCLCG